MYYVFGVFEFDTKRSERSQQQQPMLDEKRHAATEKGDGEQQQCRNKGEVMASDGEREN